jgi:hypothetical protein
LPGGALIEKKCSKDAVVGRLLGNQSKQLLTMASKNSKPGNNDKLLRGRTALVATFINE